MPEKRGKDGLTRQERWKKKQGERWKEHRRKYMRQYNKTRALLGLAKKAARE